MCSVSCHRSHLASYIAPLPWTPRGLPSHLQTHQAHSCLRAFALAASSACKVFVLNTYRPHSPTSFKALHKCHLSIVARTHHTSSAHSFANFPQYLLLSDIPYDSLISCLPPPPPINEYKIHRRIYVCFASLTHPQILE